MKPNDSATITSLKERRSKIGMQAGEHGSATPAVLAQRLAAKRVFQVEADLVSRASSLGVVLDIRDDYLPDQGLVFRGVTASGGMTGCIDALEVYRMAMTPATSTMIEDWLVELSVIAPSRAEDEITNAVKIAAYTRRLLDYPADVAREALLVREWRFFPSWEELSQVCKALVRRREAIMRELDRAAERAANRAERADNDRRQTTPAQRAAFASRVMSEVFGGKRMGGEA